MTSITVLGGTGFAGRHIVAEAASRGHQVTVWSRNAPASPTDGVTYRTADLLDPAALAEALAGADVVIETLSPRGELAGRLRGLVTEIAGRLTGSAARLGVIGGAGSLQVSPGGPRLLDGDFPADYKPEALELAAVLDDLRASDPALDWFLLSPAASFGAWHEGERTGVFRVGGDVLLTDASGNSSISAPDLAVAVVDEIEKPAHHRERFTVAY